MNPSIKRLQINQVQENLQTAELAAWKLMQKDYWLVHDLAVPRLFGTPWGRIFGINCPETVDYGLTQCCTVNRSSHALGVAKHNLVRRDDVRVFLPLGFVPNI